MSIYPQGVDSGSLVFTFQVAALDLPIPDHLTGNDADQRAWSNYASAISPARLISKFAEAVDSVLDLIPQNGAVDQLDQATSEKLYSRWTAAAILHVSVSKRLSFGQDPSVQNAQKSDIDHMMFFVEDLLKAVVSPETQSWSNRRAAYDITHTNAFDRFLSRMSVEDRNRRQTPPSGP